MTEEQKPQQLQDRASLAIELGFSSLEEMEAWEAAGSPTLACSNEKCGWTGLWPMETCLHCGWPLVETGRIFKPEPEKGLGCA